LNPFQVGLTWEGYFEIAAACSRGIKTFCAKTFIFVMLQLEIAPDNAAADHLDLE